jgi:hypothetical protein
MVSEERMTGHKISLKGVRVKDGKLSAIPSYGRNASAKIAQRKSKKTRVVRRAPG